MCCGLLGQGSNASLRACQTTEVASQHCHRHAGTEGDSKGRWATPRGWEQDRSPSDGMEIQGCRASGTGHQRQERPRRVGSEASPPRQGPGTHIRPLGRLHRHLGGQMSLPQQILLLVRTPPELAHLGRQICVGRRVQQGSAGSVTAPPAQGGPC